MLLEQKVTTLSDVSLCSRILKVHANEAPKSLHFKLSEIVLKKQSHGPLSISTVRVVKLFQSRPLSSILGSGSIDYGDDSGP